MSKLFKMLKVEFNISWKTLIVTSLAITILSLIPIMVRKDINVNQGNVLISTVTMVSPTITQVYVYVVMVRMRSVIQDKSTLDKNRTAFLTHDKSTVVFSKVFMDMVSFILPIILTVGIGIPMVYGKNGSLDSEHVNKLIALLFGITFAYVCTSLGMRYIDTLAVDRIKKYVIMGIWVLLTIGVTVIGAMVIGILGHVKKDGLTNSTDITNWLKQNGLGDIKTDTDTNTPITISEELMHKHHILSYNVNYIATPTKEMLEAHKGAVHSSVSASSISASFMPGYHLTSINVQDWGIYTDSSMNIQHFFKDNEIVISLIPLLNFLTPFLPFYNLIHAWTIVPLILEVVIFVGIIWKPLTRRLRTHLTT